MKRKKKTMEMDQKMWDNNGHNSTFKKFALKKNAKNKISRNIAMRKGFLITPSLIQEIFVPTCANPIQQ